MRLKGYKKKKISDYLGRGIIIIVMSVIGAIIFINSFSKRAEEILLPMAEAKLRKIVATLINESTNDLKFDKDLFTLVKDSNGEIKMVNYNSYEVTKLINEVTGNIESRFDKIHDGDSEEGVLGNYIIQEIPFGVLMGKSLLRGIGPKIRIKSEMVGSMVSKIETEVKPYGINNAYVETRIHLAVRGKIYLPFVTKDVEISNVIPISLNIVQGSVPSGYIASYK